MSTHNIHVHDKIGNFLELSLQFFCFLVLSKELPRDPKTHYENMPIQIY